MKFTLKKKIVLLVTVPAILIGIAALLVSNIMVTKAMRDEIMQQLKVAAYSGVEYYEFANEEPFTKADDGTVKKGDTMIISGDYQFVDKLITNSGIQSTFFYGDERVATSIQDEAGQRLVGTKASEKVVETVLKQGQDYFTNGININGTEYYGYYTPIKQTGTDEIIGMFFAGDTVAQVQKAIYPINATIGIVILIILIISILLAVFIVLSITDALGRTVSQLDELAQGSLTFQEHEKDMKRNDEIGELVHATIKLKKSLVKVISEVMDTTNVLHSAAEELEQVADQTSTTTEGIEKAVEDMASGAMSQAESTSEASKQIHLMGEGIEHTTTAVEQLRTTSSIMDNSSKDAITTLEELNQVNQKTKIAIDNIYRQTNETNEFAQKIKEATNVITSIAEETNLLSLNASIEAARAGESGRGFAVVADQIKKLAEQSSESAKQIEFIIQTLIENSDKAVEIMEEVRSVSKVQNDNLEKTKVAFQMVTNGVHESVQNVNMISEISAQLNVARISVIDIINNLSAVSQENAASTEETSAATAQLSSAMTNVEEEINVLRGLADDLAKSIRKFKL